MKDLQLHALNPKIIKLHQGLLVFFIQDFYASLTTVISCSSAKAGWALIWLRRVSAPPSRSRPLASRPSRPPPVASPRRRGRSRPAPRRGAAAPPSPSSPPLSSPIRLTDVCYCTSDKIFFLREGEAASFRVQDCLLLFVYLVHGELARLYSNQLFGQHCT